MIALTRNFSHPDSCRVVLFAQGAAVLVLGLFYYVFLREPGALYGISASNYLGSNMKYQSQAFVLSLPSFLHVAAFVCITYAIAGPGKAALLAATGGWFAVDSLFELAQYGPFAYWIAEHVPAWFDTIPVLENIRRHFMFGTFDPSDLAAIGCRCSKCRVLDCK